ncbi:hypothetical protein BDR05DRAFT_97466 [Suillus weaverae]|nr:hypothetical protein BDR05DRAFT_97466 [Suillus weaverae]
MMPPRSIKFTPSRLTLRFQDGIGLATRQRTESWVFWLRMPCLRCSDFVRSGQAQGTMSSTSLTFGRHPASINKHVLRSVDHRKSAPCRSKDRGIWLYEPREPSPVIDTARDRYSRAAMSNASAAILVKDIHSCIMHHGRPISALSAVLRTL